MQFIADIPPSRGPLSGVATSLTKIRTAHLLALAIDIPFMTETTSLDVRRDDPAAASFRKPTMASSRSRRFIRARQRNRVFREALMGTDFSLRTLTRRQVESGKLREIRVAEQDQTLFLNVNGLSDIRRCSRGPAGHSAPAVSSILRDQPRGGRYRIFRM